ncbi:MAG: HAD family hydrolase [Bacilli bacterium]|nr:HAD family hydrolase [Bacilli bacterium]
MLKAVFFDLDGTLLPMDEQEFTKGYFKFLLEKVSSRGYGEPSFFIDTIWKGVYAMYKNDGTMKNEDRFWNVFDEAYQEDKSKDKPIFDSFYVNEFKKAKAFTAPNPLAREIVDYCHSYVEHTILSTNPIFPRGGQITRLSFIGLKEDDFEYITDYSNSVYCKPNPMYFKSLLEKFNLKPEEVILFGNNNYEDGDCASSLGIKTYLVKGYIIYNPKAKGTYEEIEMKDIIPTIEKEKELRK